MICNTSLMIMCFFCTTFPTIRCLLLFSSRFLHVGKHYYRALLSYLLFLENITKLMNVQYAAAWVMTFLHSLQTLRWLLGKLKRTCHRETPPPVRILDNTKILRVITGLACATEFFIWSLPPGWEEWNEVQVSKDIIRSHFGISLQCCESWTNWNRAP